MSELECSLFKMGRMGVLEEVNVYLKRMCCVLKVCLADCRVLELECSLFIMGRMGVLEEVDVC